MDAAVQKAISGLESKGFRVILTDNAQQARETLLAHIPAQATVGVGGSVSVRDTGVLDALKARGQTVCDHWLAAPEERPAVLKGAMEADVYLTSCNALTSDGRPVLIDGTGNRVGAVAFGPKTVFFVVSLSKLVEGGINAAVARIKKVACPANARRLGLDTPCARTGACNAPICEQSMCRLTLTLDRVPTGRQMTVVLVQEALGY